jgi:hypothetical protein
MEQLTVEILFQRFHLVADRCGGDIQFFGSAFEAAVTRRSFEADQGIGWGEVIGAIGQILLILVVLQGLYFASAEYFDLVKLIQHYYFCNCGFGMRALSMAHLRCMVSRAISLCSPVLWPGCRPVPGGGHLFL